MVPSYRHSYSLAGRSNTHSRVFIPQRVVSFAEVSSILFFGRRVAARRSVTLSIATNGRRAWSHLLCTVHNLNAALPSSGGTRRTCFVFSLCVVLDNVGTEYKGVQGDWVSTAFGRDVSTYRLPPLPSSSFPLSPPSILPVRWSHPAHAVNTSPPKLPLVTLTCLRNGIENVCNTKQGASPQGDGGRRFSALPG